MSVYRVRYEKAGGHIHCTLFCAKHPNQTYANCGTFCVSEGEAFDSLRAAFSGAEFLRKATLDDPVGGPKVTSIHLDEIR